MTIKSSCDKNGVTDKQNIQGKDDFFLYKYRICYAKCKVDS